MSEHVTVSGIIPATDFKSDDTWLMSPGQPQLWLGDFVRRDDSAEIIRCNLAESTHMIVGIDGDKAYVLRKPGQTGSR
jgi:hypothetical protein